MLRDCTIGFNDVCTRKLIWPLVSPQDLFAASDKDEKKKEIFEKAGMDATIKSRIALALAEHLLARRIIFALMPGCFVTQALVNDPPLPETRPPPVYSVTFERKSGRARFAELARSLYLSPSEVSRPVVGE